GASTLTWYSPTSSKGSVYSPLPVVRVTLCTLVPTFVAVTFTPETAAPVESVTVPRIEVDVVCANSSAHTRSDAPRNRRLFMLILSLRSDCNKSIQSGRLCQYGKTAGVSRGPLNG